MKRILITVFLLTIISGITNSCVLLAQNMATESYNPYSAWNMANITGYCHMERCEYCSQFIISYSYNDIELNMQYHIEENHPDKVVELGEENLETGFEEPVMNEPVITDSGISYMSVVNIHDVADAMDEIGMCTASWFIDEYNAYYNKYVENETVIPYYVNELIKTKFEPAIVNLNTAINYNYPFVLFAKPSSFNVNSDLQEINGKFYFYYNVISSNILTNYDYFDICYKYIFPVMYANE